MQQTIQDRRRQNLVAEYRSPFRYPLNRRDQHAPTLVTTIHQLKKQSAGEPLERKISQFVDDQKPRLGKLALLQLERPL